MEDHRDARFEDWSPEVDPAPDARIQPLDHNEAGARRRRLRSSRLALDLGAAPAAAPVTDAPQEVDSADLMQGARLLAIRHNGAVYTLRVTRQDKLLLTK